MRILYPVLSALLGLAVAAATPALAHHRQTAEVLRFTDSGDTALPRLPAPGGTTLVLSVPNGPQTQLVTIKPFFSPGVQDPVPSSANATDPAISYTGRTVAFATTSDPLGTGGPGSQLVVSSLGTAAPVIFDPSGTSLHPTVDATGRRVAFESTADLANNGNPGVRQVFLKQVDGSVSQLSRGLGASANPVISARGTLLAFESASDASTGANTGVSQIWAGQLSDGSFAPVTNGNGPSRNVTISDDGRILAFESTADLAGTKADTGTPQIFIYDVKSRTSAQVTFDAGGCTVPAVQKVRRDYRIGFVCSGQGDFFMLRTNQRFHVDTNGGVVQRIIPQLGIHFVTMSTTGDLLGAGTTTGKRIYMVNLFKRPPALTATAPAKWFPFQGLSSL